VDDLLLGDPAEGVTPVSGQAAAMIAAARADNVALVSEAQSKLQVFANEVAAYQAAPRLYRMRKWLEMLTRAVEGVRKVVLVGDREDMNVIFEIEMEKQGVLDLTAEPEPSAEQ
jgi:regulator of protease activity HflC (stomatin/prohibitin superfamily)